MPNLDSRPPPTLAAAVCPVVRAGGQRRWPRPLGWAGEGHPTEYKPLGEPPPPPLPPSTVAGVADGLKGSVL